MATPVPGRMVASEVKNVKMEQTYTFYYNSGIKKTEIQQKNMMMKYRGLWTTVNIPPLISPNMNLIYLLPFRMMVQTQS